MQPQWHPFWISGSISLFYLVMVSSVRAQTVVNVALDLSVVTSSDSTSIIIGSTQASPNLFHNLQSNNSVNPEQVVAGGCLMHRNEEQGNFTISGMNGLPSSPYGAISGRYDVTGVQPIQGGGPVSRRAAVEKPAPWKPGDPIQEAQGIVVTADGRTIVGTISQLSAITKDPGPVCHPN